MANVKNIRSFSGWGYFRKTGEDHFVSFGHVESLSRAVEVEKEDIWCSGSGNRTKEDTDIIGKSASIAVTLRETNARNFAIASLSDESFFVQDAATAEILSGTDMPVGGMVELGYLNATNVVVTDGTDDLKLGQDYELDAAAGTIEFLTAQSTYDITFDAPAITESDAKIVSKLLSADEGISGELVVVQKQTRGSTRYKFSCSCTLFPDGDQTLIKEDTGKDTITLSGDIKKVDGEFGELVEIDN